MNLLEKIQQARQAQSSGGGTLLDSIKAARAKSGPKVVFTTPDGGQVFRSASGQMSYKDDGFATSDPAKIDEILSGATAGEISLSSFDQDVIEQAPITSRAIKAAEGVPFVGSYVDEAAGAMFGDDAKQGVRAASGAMDREHPNQSLALQVGGSVAAAVPMAISAAPAISGMAAGTRGGQVLQAGIAGAGLGAVEGGIYGAGEGEGHERGRNAQEGAIFGGMVGGAVGAAAPLAADAIKATVSRLKGSDVKVIQKTLGISPAAARVVRNALETNDVESAVAAIRRGGDDAMLADAGVATQELLDAGANTSGAAAQITRDAMAERSTVASEKFTKALDKTLGKPSGRDAMGKSVRDETSASRSSTYDAAYAKPIDYSGAGGRRIEALLPRIPESAIRDANALMKAEGMESAQIMAKIADDGSVTFETLPDVRQLDYIARALGGVADKMDGQGKLGGQTPLGRAYRGLQKTLRTTLRKEVPEYARALDTAADAITRVQAGEVGYSLLRSGTTRETIKDALNGASRAERDAMAQGVRTQIDDTIANVAETLTDKNVPAREAIKGLRDLSTRANRSKLTMLLGQKRANILFKELDEVRATFELRAALAANSKTNIRGNIQDSVRSEAEPKMVEVLADGKPVEAARKFVQALTGDSKEAQGLREAGIFEEIATVLTHTRGAKAQRALRIVQNAIDGRQVSSAQASFIGNVVATSGALSGHRTGTQALATQ